MQETGRAYRVGQTLHILSSFSLRRTTLKGGELGAQKIRLEPLSHSAFYLQQVTCDYLWMRVWMWERQLLVRLWILCLLTCICASQLSQYLWLLVVTLTDQHCAWRTPYLRLGFFVLAFINRGVWCRNEHVGWDSRSKSWWYFHSLSFRCP